jgi:hypothetical protein
LRFASRKETTSACHFKKTIGRFGGAALPARLRHLLRGANHFTQAFLCGLGIAE